CARLIAAVLLAPARTFLRPLPAAAARAGTGARFPGESLGGWRSAGENRDQSRRTRDPRLVHAHRRARIARLLPPAGERGGFPGDHARWANRAAIPLQAWWPAAGATFGPAAAADGLCRLA